MNDLPINICIHRFIYKYIYSYLYSHIYNYEYIDLATCLPTPLPIYLSAYVCIFLTKYVIACFLPAPSGSFYHSVCSARRADTRKTGKTQKCAGTWLRHTPGAENRTFLNSGNGGCTASDSGRREPGCARFRKRFCLSKAMPGCREGGSDS